MYISMYNGTRFAKEYAGIFFLTLSRGRQTFPFYSKGRGGTKIFLEEGDPKESHVCILHIKQIKAQKENRIEITNDFKVTFGHWKLPATSVKLLMSSGRECKLLHFLQLKWCELSLFMLFFFFNQNLNKNLNQLLKTRKYFSLHSSTSGKCSIVQFVSEECWKKVLGQLILGKAIFKRWDCTPSGCYGMLFR